MAVDVYYWEGEFANINDEICKVKIYKNRPIDTPSGEDINYIFVEELEFGINPVVIEKSTDQNLFDTIIPTLCTINLESDESLKYANFCNLTVDDQDNYDTYLVEVIKNNNIPLFKGNIITDLYQEDWSQADGNKQVIQIQAACGLNNLKNVKRGSVGNLTGIWTNGVKRPLQEILQILLADTGINIDLGVYTDLGVYDYVVKSTLSNGLNDIYIEPEVWSTADGYVDNYVIVKEILSSFGMGIVQNTTIDYSSGSPINILIWQVYRYNALDENVNAYNKKYRALLRPESEDDDYGYNPSSIGSLPNPSVYQIDSLYKESNGNLYRQNINGYWVDSSQYLLSEKGIEKQQINLNWVNRPTFSIDGRFNETPIYKDPHVNPEFTENKWSNWESLYYKTIPNLIEYETNDNGRQWVNNGNTVQSYLDGNTYQAAGHKRDTIGTTQTGVDKYNPSKLSYLGYKFDISEYKIDRNTEIKFGINYASTGMFSGSNANAQSRTMFFSFFGAFNNSGIVRPDGKVANLWANFGGYPSTREIDDMGFFQFPYATVGKGAPYGSNGGTNIPYSGSVEYTVKGGDLIEWIDNSEGGNTPQYMTFYIVDPIQLVTKDDANQDYHYMSWDNFYINVNDITVKQNQIFFGGIDDQKFRKAGETIDTRIGVGVNDENADLYLSSLYFKRNNVYHPANDFRTGKFKLENNELMHVLIKSVLDMRSRNVIKLNGRIKKEKRDLNFTNIITDVDMNKKGNYKFILTNYKYNLYHDIYDIETVEVTDLNLSD